MEGEKRMRFLVIENSMMQNERFRVYVLRASSMQLHPFMLGVDVARRAEGISTPPFRTSGAGKPAPKTITGILYG